VSSPLLEAFLAKLYTDSIALERFQEITKVPGISFVNLLKDVRPTEKDSLASAGAITDLMPEVTDFYDTAALVQALDLVVSVDTAVLHLAGALGKPVWVLLPFAPDWRWMTNREDSPWYPTARLFRQQKPGDWNEVLGRVASELAALRRDA